MSPSSVTSSQRNPEDGGATLLRNYLLVDMSEHLRIFKKSKIHETESTWIQCIYNWQSSRKYICFSYVSITFSVKFQNWKTQTATNSLVSKYLLCRPLCLVHKKDKVPEVPGKMGTTSTTNSHGSSTAQVTELVISETGWHFSKTVQMANLPRA